ncbi:hypothetical protein [Nocardia brevicatena]|uniref:hypothetical protein n=1 Tax=Nocardia brevicatena TaxID=37327 RepID=UPI000301484B|nr:hypothetical protein [Nocardia brevicatena]
MGILGFTWADAGAFVGGALGGAFLGPPGAMLGSAVFSFAGAAWGDDKSADAAMEEAIVSGIGAAGGAWATNLAGKLLKDGIGAAATKVLPAGAARGVDKVAAKALLPWNGHEGGPIAAFGGAIGGYEVSPQARSPVVIATADIGNGGCPVQMSTLRMPTDLTGPVGDMYRVLPRYLCDVWRSFGSGAHAVPPALELPVSPTGTTRSGIGEYAGKARRLDAMMAGFAELDRRVAELAGNTARLSDEGRAAVGALIDTANGRASEPPAAETSIEIHALDLLNDAFEQGRHILSHAVASSNRVADKATALGDEIDALRRELNSHMRRHPETDVPERREHVRPVIPPQPWSVACPVPPPRPDMEMPNCVPPSVPFVDPPRLYTPDPAPRQRPQVSSVGTTPAISGEAGTSEPVDVGAPEPVALSPTPWTRPALSAAHEVAGPATPPGEVTGAASSEPPVVPPDFGAGSMPCSVVRWPDFVEGPQRQQPAPPISSTRVCADAPAPIRPPWSNAVVSAVPPVGGGQWGLLSRPWRPLCTEDREKVDEAARSVGEPVFFPLDDTLPGAAATPAAPA